EKDIDGNNIGGPMYYLKNGVKGGFGKTLGFLFALFGAIAAFGIGNGVQINSMAAVLEKSFSIPTYATGLIVATLVGFVIVGGVKRIGEVASKLVPTMIVLYMASALMVIIINIAEVPSAFVLIVESAFNPVAAAGGFGGAAVAAAIRFGVARGVFSNESGLGSAAIAHGASQTKDPVKQGLIAMLGTFIDTIIVCTMTALVIITSGEWLTGANGAVLTSNAYENSFAGGQYVVAISLAIFSFTTLLGWSYYGER
ncbi:MAG: alanine:cation symporter family protein, partial [Gammaproteobacteria bacterium]|nr:alanine:cation symporter family protein [Gammaproteobacteria bacterium]